MYFIKSVCGKGQGHSLCPSMYFMIALIITYGLNVRPILMFSYFQEYNDLLTEG